MDKVKFATIESAIEDFKQGKFVIVVDDEDRENEGDFITPAEMITPDKVNFMLREGRGVLCTPITIRQAATRNQSRNTILLESFILFFHVNLACSQSCICMSLLFRDCSHANV